MCLIETEQKLKLFQPGREVKAAEWKLVQLKNNQFTWESRFLFIKRIRINSRINWINSRFPIIVIPQDLKSIWQTAFKATVKWKRKMWQKQTSPLCGKVTFRNHFTLLYYSSHLLVYRGLLLLASLKDRYESRINAEVIHHQKIQNQIESWVVTRFTSLMKT